MTAPVQLAEGAIIANKYRVERVLGSGGMGIVVAARHIVLEERVALKFLLPEALASVEGIGRFIREARAATKIKNEHVARVTDVGQLEDGSPFIVMEYLEGLDISTWLAERGPMPIQQGVDFLLQACEAIAEAHMRGIVHRDLKPANLFCVTKPDGTPSIKVLDFGISKVTTPGAAEDHKLTKPTSVIGSPVYMSPEQMRRSVEVDPRTDVWSLGVILFEMLTAQTPFHALTLPELAIQVATEPPALLRTALPSAPLALELAVARCLEKDRSKRFQNVGEMAVAFQDFGTNGAKQSTQTILGTLAAASSPGAPSSADRLAETGPRAGAERTDFTWGGLTGGFGRSTRRAVVLLVLAFLGVLGLAAAVAVVGRTPEAAKEVGSSGKDALPAALPGAGTGAGPGERPSASSAEAHATLRAQPSTRARNSSPGDAASPRPARPNKPSSQSDDDRLGL